MKRSNYILFLSPLMALIAPFLVWPVEQFIPLPYIVEEVVKAVFAYMILTLHGKIRQIEFAIFIGILFSLSETVLYLFNLYESNTANAVILRLIFITSMHVGTLIIMTYLGPINKKLFPLGICIAVFLHYFYNRLVVF